MTVDFRVLSNVKQLFDENDRSVASNEPSEIISTTIVLHRFSCKFVT